MSSAFYSWSLFVAFCLAVVWAAWVNLTDRERRRRSLGRTDSERARPARSIRATRRTW
jgi:hypothetical protein